MASAFPRYSGASVSRLEIPNASPSESHQRTNSWPLLLIRKYLTRPVCNRNRCDAFSPLLIIDSLPLISRRVPSEMINWHCLSGIPANNGDLERIMESSAKGASEAWSNTRRLVRDGCIIAGNHCPLNWSEFLAPYLKTQGCFRPRFDVVATTASACDDQPSIEQRPP